jgi:hypothetical protein
VPLSPKLSRSLIALAALFVAILPVLTADVPPLLDYPNHMVRFWLLSGAADAQPLSRFFVVDWSRTATNIGMDVLAATLGRLFPAETTGRIVLALSGLLPPTGVALLSRHIHGRWSWWHPMLFLLAWPLVLLAGFMSFQLALGTALICALVDERLKDQRLKISIARRTAEVVAVAMVHPFGALLYLALALGLGLGRDFPTVRHKFSWPRVGRLAMSISLPFLLATILVVVRLVVAGGAPDAGYPQFIWQDGFWQSITTEHVLFMLVEPLRSYSMSVDIACLVLLILPIVISAIRNRLDMHWGVLLVGAGFLILGLFSPQNISSTSLVDLRLLTMALLTLSVAVLPESVVDWRLAIIMTFAALVVVGARGLWLGQIWQARQADISSLKRALAPVPAGARVMPMMLEADEGKEPLGRYLGDITPTFEHLPSLVVLYRRAYVPTMFAQAGKQPLGVRAPYNQDNEPSGGVLGNPRDVANNNGHAAAYLPHWRDEFDYVLMINADTGVAIAPVGTCMVSDEGFARLYRVSTNC